MAMTLCTGTGLDTDIYNDSNIDAAKMSVIDDATPAKLYIAAKRKKMAQVHLFEYFDDLDKRE